MFAFESQRLITVFGVSSYAFPRSFGYVLIPVLCLPFTALVGIQWIEATRWILLCCCICYVILLSFCSYSFCVRIRKFIKMLHSIQIDVDEECSHALCILIRSFDPGSEAAVSSIGRLADAARSEAEGVNLLSICDMR